MLAVVQHSGVDHSVSWKERSIACPFVSHAVSRGVVNRFDLIGSLLSFGHAVPHVMTCATGFLLQATGSATMLQCDLTLTCPAFLTFQIFTTRCQPHAPQNSTSLPAGNLTSRMIRIIAPCPSAAAAAKSPPPTLVHPLHMGTGDARIVPDIFIGRLCRAPTASWHVHTLWTDFLVTAQSCA